MKRKKNHLIYGISILLLLSMITTDLHAQSDYRVFYPYYRQDQVWMKYTDLPHALYHHIAQLAEEEILERKEETSKLESKDEWKEYLERKRTILRSKVREFKKTPLNARTTSTVEKENFRVENVVFESFPGFYVTGSLFLPRKGKKPLPAVIYASGHTEFGYRAEAYQRVILNLVKKGFIVFAFDPIGQGQRRQYLDSLTNGPVFLTNITYEHSYAGGQCLLSGFSVNEYFVWDGIRAIDYLYSRPEVDKSRIGLTGRSGGGQQTAVLSAIDDRIYAAAPECYITSYRRIFESIGPQDAEQNIYRVLEHGIEHADLLAVRVPKPAMIVTTTQDFFNIQGARETHEEVKDIYRVFGHAEDLQKVEDYARHMSTEANRERVYAFFQKYLNLPGNSEDEEVEFLTGNELNVVPTGQVVSSLQSKTIFDLNKQEASTIIKNRSLKTAGDLKDNRQMILEKIRNISGFDSSRTFESVVYTGKIEEPDYVIEKYFMQSNDFGYPLPFVLIKPNNEEKRPVLLYLGSEGKEELLQNPGEIKSYIDKGYTILAPDLSGTGELKNSDERGDAHFRGISYNLFVGANLVGKSIAGIQAEDLDVLFRHINQRKDVDASGITAIVKDDACSSYLHFAVFNPSVKKTILVNPLVSYEDIINTEYYESSLLWTSVPGAIQEYDMPFLEALLAPSQLLIIDPVTATGDIIRPEEIGIYFSVPEDAFELEGTSAGFKLVLTSDETARSIIESAL